MSKDWIKITADFSSEFTSKITLNNVTYIVQTELKGKNSPRAISLVYQGGKVLFTKETNYSYLAGQHDFADNLNELMERQHKSVIEQFTSRILKKQKKKPEYFDEIKDLLRKGKGEKALSVLKDSLEQYPSDPFFLSYYGCLTSVVANKPKDGIKICRDAITKLDQYVSLGKELLYPIFYLNLGRAYLGANKKKEALIAFKRGLKEDPTNKDIFEEIRKLGIRRELPVPFLKRSNPLNRYIGLLLRKMGSALEL